MTNLTKILVAEGNRDEAKRLSAPLVQRGWSVILAHDGVSATSAVLRERPHAVVLNQRLPGGGGVLTLRRLRASVHTAMTPVIAIAGLRAEDRDELDRNGADECVASPPDPAAIAAWINERLGQPAQVLEAPAAIIRDVPRLDSLDRTGLLDSQPTVPFDTLTRIASALLDAPVVLVSLVDKNRQFFKSQFGLPEPWASRRETPLTHSFCQWVVSDHEALIVADAREHAVLKHNRALHELGVIAYAGIPMTPVSGEPIGSFCAIDTKPRVWTEDDLKVLRQFHAAVEACIALSEFHQAAIPDAEIRLARRSLTLRAVGDGMSQLAGILGRGHPRLSSANQKALLNLMEWFGQQITRLSLA